MDTCRDPSGLVAGRLGPKMGAKEAVWVTFLSHLHAILAFEGPCRTLLGASWTYYGLKRRPRWLGSMSLMPSGHKIHDFGLYFWGRFQDFPRYKWVQNLDQFLSASWRGFVTVLGVVLALSNSFKKPET